MATTTQKLATLVFIENDSGEQLLLRRKKVPNLGLWTPIGGKLETSLGESPHECAVRETFEETGFEVAVSDLRLFSIVTEKNYPGSCHWMLFLFHCKKPIPTLPSDIDEGSFGFHRLQNMGNLPIPASDKELIWPIYKTHRNNFSCVSIDYEKPRQHSPFTSVIEQLHERPD